MTTAAQKRASRLRRKWALDRISIALGEPISNAHIGSTLPPSVVLQAWHVDEHGFLARSVGNTAEQAARRQKPAMFKTTEALRIDDEAAP